MSDVPNPDLRNVKDQFKGWATELIKDDLKTHFTGIDILMINIEQDFNFASLIRSSNNFGVSKVYYIGPKKWDKRGAMGTYHYTDIVHLGNDISDCLDFFVNTPYDIVMLETNIDSPLLHPIEDYQWPSNPLLVLGSESQGIPGDLFLYAHSAIEIPALGSTRSLNVACAASVALYDYVSKIPREKVLVKNE